MMGLKCAHLVEKRTKIKVILVFMIRIPASPFIVAPPIVLMLDDPHAILAVPQRHILNIPFFLRLDSVMVSKSTTRDTMISPMISCIFALHSLQGIPGCL